MFKELLNTLREFSKNNVSLNQINDYMEKYSKISEFFTSQQHISEFLNIIENIVLHESYWQEKKTSRKLYGDFQTPLDLIRKIFQLIKIEKLHEKIVVEPTCGTGNFITEALTSLSNLKVIMAIEIQPQYEWIFKSNILTTILENNLISKPLSIQFYLADIFTLNLGKEIEELLDKYDEKNDEILIIGNPPWVTNSALAGNRDLFSTPKSNFKKIPGIDAITGKSNFDITETILLYLLQNLAEHGITGHMIILCKDIVIRNLMKDMRKINLKIADIRNYQIDAKQWFDVNTSASLLFLEFGKSQQNFCTTYKFADFPHLTPIKKFGWVNNQFVSDLAKYHHGKIIEGTSSLIWRQGIKHDLTKVMVLKKTSTGPLKKIDVFRNGLGETLRIETKLVYPLLKSSDIRELIIRDHRYFVIIPQQKVGQSTHHIQKEFPLLWDYLQKHKAKFAARKSRIYNNKPDFSIFGIGPYSFKPYKVAISGFYKTPLFAFIQQIVKKPVMIDDTAYFLSFENVHHALCTFLLLQSTYVPDFLESIVFPNTKRPYTKTKLMRIDFQKLLEKVSVSSLLKLYQKNYESILGYNLTSTHFQQFSDYVIHKATELS